jgi:hypothetical protein
VLQKFFLLTQRQRVGGGFDFGERAHAGNSSTRVR